VASVISRWQVIADGRQSVSRAAVEAAADPRTVASNPAEFPHMSLRPSKAAGASERGFTGNVCR
jgi:hypothetical protein